MPENQTNPTPAVPTVKAENIRFRGVNKKTLEQEIARGKIMEAAIEHLKKNPDFDPAALSISFGLRW